MESYVACKFGLYNDENDPIHEGFFKPSDGLWNGWLCPYVNEKTFKDIVAYIMPSPEDDEDGEWQKFASQKPNIDGLYNVGWSICWLREDVGNQSLAISREEKKMELLKVYTDDLTDYDHRQMRGYVYLLPDEEAHAGDYMPSFLHIEKRLAKGRMPQEFYLMLERSEYYSDDIEELESYLLGWIAGEHQVPVEEIIIKEVDE